MELDASMASARQSGALPSAQLFAEPPADTSKDAYALRSPGTSSGRRAVWQASARGTLAQLPAMVISATRIVGDATLPLRSRSLPTASMAAKSSLKFRLMVTSATGNAKAPSSIQ